MNPGDLRHRITIQRAHEQPDNLGGMTTVWETEAEVWAAIWPVSAREVVSNAQLVGQVSHRVRIRYLEGVAPRMRILFGARTLNILSVVNPEERNELLDLICMELV
jgi:SPP1 family predicted phage head-tail adaptor